jgi:hypothetical protein
VEAASVTATGALIGENVDCQSLATLEVIASTINVTDMTSHDIQADALVVSSSISTASLLATGAIVADSIKSISALESPKLLLDGTDVMSKINDQASIITELQKTVSEQSTKLIAQQAAIDELNNLVQAISDKVNKE